VDSDLEQFQRAQLATLYLLKHRGESLQAVAPAPLTGGAQAVLHGLCDADRQVRARWLAFGLTDLLSDLAARRLDLAQAELSP
jgi:hypothetical protein